MRKTGCGPLREMFKKRIDNREKEFKDPILAWSMYKEGSFGALTVLFNLLCRREFLAFLVFLSTLPEEVKENVLGFWQKDAAIRAWWNRLIAPLNGFVTFENVMKVFSDDKRKNMVQTEKRLSGASDKDLYLMVMKYTNSIRHFLQTFGLFSVPNSEGLDYPEGKCSSLEQLKRWAEEQVQINTHYFDKSDSEMERMEREGDVLPVDILLAQHSTVITVPERLHNITRVFCQTNKAVERFDKEVEERLSQAELVYEKE